jgi:hypothetical protein
MTGTWDVTDKEYFASPYLSRSKLWAFRKSIPEFHARYIAKTVPEKEPTDEMVLGTMAHAYLLERDVSGIIELPDYNLRRKEDREDKERFLADHADKICATTEDIVLAKNLSHRIKQHKLSFQLFNNRRHVEQYWRWTDEYGNECCCKTDFVTTFDGMNIICDPKFCKDISESAFANDVPKYGYHWQSKFYIDGLNACNQGIDAFAHILISNQEESFGDDVAVRFIGDDSLTGNYPGSAANQIQRWSERYANCVALNEWKSRNEAPTHTEMARWALYQE